jgi:hypothetical protein
MQKLAALTLVSSLTFGNPILAQAWVDDLFRGIFRNADPPPVRIPPTRPNMRIHSIQRVADTVGQVITTIQVGNSAYQIYIDCRTGITSGAEGVIDNQTRFALVRDICSRL